VAAVAEILSMAEFLETIRKALTLRDACLCSALWCACELTNWSCSPRKLFLVDKKATWHLWHERVKSSPPGPFSRFC
jgi:hypothetical protein